jgi:hypothetical protein
VTFVSLRRAAIIAVVLAALSQALVLGAYYVGTQGFAGATLTVGTPPPTATQQAALALALSAEPVLRPATYLDGRHPLAAAEDVLGQAPGAWAEWGPYVFAGLFNTLAWASLGVLPLWAAGLIIAWVRRRTLASRAV